MTWEIAGTLYLILVILNGYSCWQGIIEVVAQGSVWVRGLHYCIEEVHLLS